ncbi:Fic family protein [Rhodococcus jostii]|uniref:Fic family protein n=1 Tax=Rhodococcus jostii TaxID=132919 RepID=UPI00366577CC
MVSADWDNLDREEFAQRVAVVFAYLNQAHPFREGNGRTAKVFMDHVAEQSRFEFDYTRIPPRFGPSGRCSAARTPTTTALAQLSTDVGLGRQELDAALAPMVQREYIGVIDDHAVITAHGEQAIAARWAAHERVEEELYAGFSEQDRHQLRSLLHRIQDNAIRIGGVSLPSNRGGSSMLRSGQYREQASRIDHDGRCGYESSCHRR